MADLNLLNDDAFSVSTLSAAINMLPATPAVIGNRGTFNEQGITTTTVNIEISNGVLSLVPSAQRGAPGLVVGANKRKLIPFNTFHLPATATIMADEIQNVRAFGSATELQVLQTIVNDRLANVRRRLDATHEWQRIGAIKGKIIDADGSTELLDIYSAFGIQQPTQAMALGTTTTEVRVLCGDVLDKMETALGQTHFTHARAYCGKAFWDKLISHKSVKETYLNTVQAASLRGDPSDSFEFGGIVWERYRGQVGSQAFVPTNEAYAYPEGVSDLFISRFAPADYIETVNTIGLPYYAKQEVMKMGKGVELEAQSNPLHICTRPGAVIKLTTN